MSVAATIARRAITAGRVLRPSTTSCFARSPRAPLINSLPSLARFYADKSFPEHTVVAMPALSPTMTAGNIGAWQKKPGDSVSAGDVLVEIETDKAQMDFEYQEEGVLAKILMDSGSKDVKVGSPIAVLVEEGGDVDAFKDFSIDDAGGMPAAPKSEETKQEKKEEPSKEEKKPDIPPPEQAAESDSSGGKLQTSLERLEGLEFQASPKAKVLALEKGIRLKDVKGTGPGGRITYADVEKHKGGAAAAGGVSSPVTAGGGAPVPPYEDTEITGMRKSIATRLKESVNNSPHFFISSSCSVSKLMKVRASLNTTANGAYKLSVNDFLVKAIASALLKHPQVNSSWLEKEGVIRKYNSVDISVAVATPVGLITPIVRQAHAKGISAISAEVKGLATRARDGKLKPEEFQGGTFTISNMGMNDAVERFTAIINPPQVGIMAVGAPKKVAVEGKDGGIEWDEQIVITGSFDHRVVDGAVGAEFMKSLKKIIENPLDLLL